MAASPLPIQHVSAGDRRVAVVTIDQPDRKVAVLDRALIERLDASMDALGDDVAGVVLESNSRVFVAGADLKEISELSDAQLDDYLAYGQRVFGRFASFPGTTVAAVHGAALGGGLEIAMHCDVLIAQRPADAARPYQLGLVEATLQIVPGWGGTNLLPARMEPALAISMTAAGKSMSVFEAAEHGLVEELHDSRESLLAAAVRIAAGPKNTVGRVEGAAGGFAPRNICEPHRREHVRAALASAEPSLPATQAAASVASCVRAGLDRGWKAALDMERRELTRLRSTDEARAALRAFFERSAAR